MPQHPAVLWAHRHVWQRLPREWRRSALFLVTAAMAPRPSAEAQASPPFIIVGAFRTASGLGQSARLCHDALKAAGLPVFGIDVTALQMQMDDFPGFSFVSGQNIIGVGTLIIHVNAPAFALAMTKLGPAILRNKRVVGCWAWELERVPSDWQHGVPLVHEIWAPSAFTASAIAPIAGDRPVRIVPYAVALHHHPADRVARSPDRPFIVLTVFNMASSFARKNPCAAVAAFRQAFGDDPMTRLIVKTSNVSTYPQGLQAMEHAAGGAPNITILDQTLSASDMDEIYDTADALISLHRSEGFGLTLAEAMLRGIPVVATDWSGNVDFLNVTTGIPVPFELIRAEDPQGTYQHSNLRWADANTQEAALALRRLRNDPDYAARIGKTAAAHARQTWSGDRYARRVLNHLGLSRD